MSYKSSVHATITAFSWPPGRPCKARKLSDQWISGSETCYYEGNKKHVIKSSIMTCSLFTAKYNCSHMCFECLLTDGTADDSNLLPTQHVHISYPAIGNHTTTNLSHKHLPSPNRVNLITGYRQRDRTESKVLRLPCRAGIIIIIIIIKFLVRLLH